MCCRAGRSTRCSSRRVNNLSFSDALIVALREKPILSGYEGQEDDPPSFDMWISQQLYHTGYRNYGTRKNEMLYVHPLDVVDGSG